MSELEVKQIIITRLTRRGLGESKKDPIRIITQYWDMDGNLLVEDDPFSKQDSTNE